jgi:hypothetical protein
MCAISIKTNGICISQSVARKTNYCTKSRMDVLRSATLLLAAFNLWIFTNLANANTPASVGVDYDIIYVRYPAKDSNDDFVTIPQGEEAYNIAPGADLIRLRPDGSEEILVDCTTCSVMDPFISYDARWVYYSKIDDIDPSHHKGGAAGGFIYKIDISGETAQAPIQLTFDDGFESHLYAGNDTEKHNQGYFRKIRDMAPVPLADGRILFTSNRAGLTAFNPATVSAVDATVIGSVQQLYVIDDHDGTANSAALSNMQRLETGTLHLAQHPMQLLDGRIIFSSWADAGTKNTFSYAMTTLFTVHPDGSNLQQFTEPHDHHRTVDHFVTQLPDEQIVVGNYYPSFDYGYGELLRMPIAVEGPDYHRYNIPDKETWLQGGGSGFYDYVSHREFDRIGMKNMTPHTDGGDSPAPNDSGKYAMPSATKSGGMLVAYSKGSVNYFRSKCEPDNRCEALKSGIYLIRDAEKTFVTNPDQLVKIKDDESYNEIWPRPVLTYETIYGAKKPNILEPVNPSSTPALQIGEAAAIVGTASMYNMDPSDREDVFESGSSRIHHDGNWTIQGAEAGLYSNEDIYAVRIIATRPKPFTDPIERFNGESTEWHQISSYLKDERLASVVAQYGSLHNERWEILGEFPLPYKNISIDQQGNPDSSWVAKVPADTPFLIQTLDKNGMVIVSELTWRGLKAGEVRTDCGGCHAHSIEPLEFDTTAAGRGTPIKAIAGINDSDQRISGGIWDLTSGSIPVLYENGVEYLAKRSLDVEFERDINPLLTKHCVECHGKSRAEGNLILDGSNSKSAYLTLIDPYKPGTTQKYVVPQRSKYIRVPQARQSLLTWVFYGQRLDGRSNSSRENDIDYPVNHPSIIVPERDKRTIARWIDLGSPSDMPGASGFGYSDDNELPVIHIASPSKNYSAPTKKWLIGFSDTKSGIDLSTISLSIQEVLHTDTGINLGPFIQIPVSASMLSKNNILAVSPPSSVTTGKEYLLKAQIRDLAGNLQISTSRFKAGSPPQQLNDRSVDIIISN